MKTIPSPRRCGYALLVTMLTLGVMAITVGSTLRWTSGNAVIIDRAILHQRAVAAAEASTEKALAAMMRDFRDGGEGEVNSRMGSYRSRVPLASEDAEWGRYRFFNNAGTAGRNQVQKVGTNPPSFMALDSQYSGLYGLASSYRVRSNAALTNGTQSVAASVQQDVQLATIPVFQFAIFYSMDLEINPGPAMTVNGRVHSNSELYANPGSTLTFQTHVTAAGGIHENKSPLDPSSARGGTVVFNAEHDSGVSSLTLPVGTDNSPEAVREILRPPPLGESPASLLGQQRYYNKSDLVVTVNEVAGVPVVTATSGAFNSFATAVDASSFVSLTNFFDQREAKTVRAVQVDVAALKTWSENNTTLRPALGGLDVSSVYVDDRRPAVASTIPGVKVRNGQTLPARGLTVASASPLYVQGHFNAPAAQLGTLNTANTKPASLVGDAITVLSQSWSDASSTLALASRVASSTTVNAAFIAGIVPSNGVDYSGGVENFPRFLEKWSNRTLTYNGSMVVMFPSATATAPWRYGSPIYEAPTRNWAFDLNFLDPAKLPPGTPAVRATIRSQWATVAPAGT
jgi:hypothetical protein